MLIYSLYGSTKPAGEGHQFTEIIKRNMKWQLPPAKMIPWFNTRWHRSQRNLRQRDVMPAGNRCEGMNTRPYQAARPHHAGQISDDLRHIQEMLEGRNGCH